MKEYMNRKTEVKIYLKNKRTPLCIVLDTDAQKTEITQQVFHNEILSIGPILFPKENLNYIIFE